MLDGSAAPDRRADDDRFEVEGDDAAELQVGLMKAGQLLARLAAGRSGRAMPLHAAR